VTGADGTNMSTPWLVTKGWAVLASYRGKARGHYVPCGHRMGPRARR
jgi:hypothetical protein